MAPPTPDVKTTHVTVNVDAVSGDVTTTQVPEAGSEGEFEFALTVTNGTTAGVAAFLSLVDPSKLKPDTGTINDSFQKVIFPFQDGGGNQLNPTFLTQMAHGSVEMAAIVLIGSSTNHQPKEAVVIVDW